MLQIPLLFQPLLVSQAEPEQLLDPSPAVEQGQRPGLLLLRLFSWAAVAVQLELEVLVLTVGFLALLLLRQEQGAAGGAVLGTETQLEVPAVLAVLAFLHLFKAPDLQLLAAILTGVSAAALCSLLQKPLRTWSFLLLGSLE